MFGKEARYWKSTKGILAELIGADEDLTDAELVQAAIDFKAEQEADDDDVPEKPTKKVEKTAVVEETKEVIVEDTVTTEAKIDKILAGMEGLGKRIGAIEKLPFRGATNGEKSKSGADDKLKYSEAQAPKFVD
jgi:hypothetical protein